MQRRRAVVVSWERFWLRSAIGGSTDERAAVEDAPRVGLDRERRVCSARATESRVHARPEERGDIAFVVEGEGLMRWARVDDGTVGEANNISPMWAIVAASSQIVIGLRVARRSPEAGGSGYEGAIKRDRAKDTKRESTEASMSEESGEAEIGNLEDE